MSSISRSPTPSWTDSSRYGGDECPPPLCEFPIIVDREASTPSAPSFRARLRRQVSRAPVRPTECNLARDVALSGPIDRMGRAKAPLQPPAFTVMAPRLHVADDGPLSYHNVYPPSITRAA